MPKQFKEQFVDVLVAMIEAKFRLFQMQQRGMLMHASELLQMGFGKAPERLDALNVRGAVEELVMAVPDAKVAVEACIYQPLVVMLAIGIDHGGHIHFAPNHGSQGLL